MRNEQHDIRQWNVSLGRPRKQSNFGCYKTSVNRGEGMDLQNVIITADTPELALEVARNAAAAP